MKEFIKKYLPEGLIEFYRNMKPSFLFNQKSYSQSGEDMIVKHIFNYLSYENVNYCDIGANSPWKFSNTANFYLTNKSDCIGVLVEPDPVLSKYLKFKRPKDTILNKGVKSSMIKLDKLDFFLMNTKTLNTFSENEAKRYEQLGYKIVDKITVDVLDVNTIFDNHFKDKTIHFLSIDVEGLDYDIIKSINYDKYKPVVICVETINFVESGFANKNLEIVKFLNSKGYFEYAFTGINSIFVHKEMWLNR